MPTYIYICDGCGETTEFFARMSDWNGLKKGETPFEDEKCPNCGSTDFYRTYDHAVHAETSPEQQRARLKKQIREDTERVASGDMDFLTNLVGSKPIDKNPGQRYMKDVKKSAFRKRK